MSSFDGEIKAAAEASSELEELLGALGLPLPLACNRQDAMAQYLSGDKGWLKARKALRGTFAKSSPVATGLTGDQDK